MDLSSLFPVLFTLLFRRGVNRISFFSFFFRQYYHGYLSSVHCAVRRAFVLDLSGDVGDFIRPSSESAGFFKRSRVRQSFFLLPSCPYFFFWGGGFFLGGGWGGFLGGGGVFFFSLVPLTIEAVPSFAGWETESFSQSVSLGFSPGKGMDLLRYEEKSSFLPPRA